MFCARIIRVILRLALVSEGKVHGFVAHPIVAVGRVALAGSIANLVYLSARPSLHIALIGDTIVVAVALGSGVALERFARNLTFVDGALVNFRARADPRPPIVDVASCGIVARVDRDRDHLLSDTTLVIGAHTHEADII